MSSVQPSAGGPLSGVRSMFSPATLKSDFLASLVVFLVALPLCMGIAISSGVDPVRGLFTGIIGGLVVGFLAGCPLQVSGPAAGLAVIVFELVESRRQAFLASHDMTGLDEAATQALQTQANTQAMMVLGLVVFLAGILQLLAGTFKLGRWFRAVSPAVVYGMLAGIGVLIFASQFHVMIDDSPHSEGLENLLTIPNAILKAFTGDMQHRYAAMVGLVTIGTIVLWGKFAPKQLKMIPAPLLAVIIATIFAIVLRLDITNVEMPENLSAEMTWPSAAWGSLLMDRSIWVMALVMAAVASAETLLCATAVDKMHDGERTKYNRELSAQGVGNVLCGLIGALPMTGVIVRSSANVQAGGKTRLSAILHGVWLLLFLVALPFVLNLIPRSALGAILVYTGYKLVNPKAIRDLWKAGKSELFIYAVTLTVIVVEDLLTGVLVGIALAALKLLYVFSHLDAEVEPAEGGKTYLHLRGACTFVRLPLLAEKLEEVPPGTELHVEMHELDYIDHACLELLIDWRKQHERTGGSLVIDWDQLHARFNGNGSDSRIPGPSQAQEPAESAA